MHGQNARAPHYTTLEDSPLFAILKRIEHCLEILHALEKDHPETQAALTIALDLLRDVPTILQMFESGRTPDILDYGSISWTAVKHLDLLLAPTITPKSLLFSERSRDEICQMIIDLIQFIEDHREPEKIVSFLNPAAINDAYGNLGWILKKFTPIISVKWIPPEEKEEDLSPFNFEIVFAFPDRATGRTKKQTVTVEFPKVYSDIKQFLPQMIVGSILLNNHQKITIIESIFDRKATEALNAMRLCAGAPEAAPPEGPTDARLKEWILQFKEHQKNTNDAIQILNLHNNELIRLRETTVSFDDKGEINTAYNHFIESSKDIIGALERREQPAQDAIREIFRTVTEESPADLPPLERLNELRKILAAADLLKDIETLKEIHQHAAETIGREIHQIEKMLTESCSPEIFLSAETHNNENLSRMTKEREIIRTLSGKYEAETPRELLLQEGKELEISQTAIPEEIDLLLTVRSLISEHFKRAGDRGSLSLPFDEISGLLQKKRLKNILFRVDAFYDKRFFWVLEATGLLSADTRIDDQGLKFIADCYRGQSGSRRNKTYSLYNADNYQKVYKILTDALTDLVSPRFRTQFCQ